MTRHLLRLIWNRKRQNFLLSVEILCAFFVLFAVVLLGLHFWSNARQPLGFDSANVWMVSMDRGEPDDDPAVKARHRQTLRQIDAALGDMAQVEARAAIWSASYSNASWESDMTLKDGRQVGHGGNRATDGLPAVMRLELVSGRWFSREDDGVSWEPVVINARMAREIFGEENAVGRTIPVRPSTRRPGPLDQPEGERRVVGVIRDFRQHGEYSTPTNYMFFRASLDSTSPNADLPRVFLLRMRPGTTAAFEAPLIRQLETIARSWTFGVTDMQLMRDEKLATYTMPLAIVGTVAGFLLLMVALGLTGVVWQSVTQRTREFGLRRAKGATAPDVRRQVIFELVLMTSLALAVGVTLVAQLPLLPLPRDLQIVTPEVFVGSIVLSAATIYLVTMACGLYPSLLATRVPPADALHYE
jgi:putative ABC transport system permease protein